MLWSVLISLVVVRNGTKYNFVGLLVSFFAPHNVSKASMSNVGNKTTKVEDGGSAYISRQVLERCLDKASQSSTTADGKNTGHGDNTVRKPGECPEGYVSMPNNVCVKTSSLLLATATDIIMQSSDEYKRQLHDEGHICISDSKKDFACPDSNAARDTDP